jgi:polyisoprenoid-binding protein YceI
MKNARRVLSLAAMMFITLSLISGCSKSGELAKDTNNKELIAASGKGKRISISVPDSKIEWEAKKVTGSHSGTVDLTSGNLSVDDGQLTGGKFDISVNTIKVLQLDDPEMNAKLTGHLKSDDFFSVEKFPTGTFVINSVTPLSDGTGNNYTIGGDLTIKGITKPITFPAKVNINEDIVTASADFKLDRTLWDIKFRSGKFYENLGDNLIYDDFGIKLNITAK